MNFVKGMGNAKLALNIAGYILGIGGLWLLIYTPMKWWGLAVTFIGSILIGGIPTMSAVFKKFKISIPILFMMIAVVVLYMQLYGAADMQRTLIGWGVGLFFISTIMSTMVQIFLSDK